MPRARAEKGGARLPREPRRKDHAYAHLFGGPIESVPTEPVPEAAPRPHVEDAPRARPGDALAALEQRVTDLERQLAELRRELKLG